MVPTLSVVLAFGLVPSARAAEVVMVPLGALAEPKETALAVPPVRALISGLDAVVQPGDESGLVLRWRVQVLEKGWIDLPMVGDALAMVSARLDGRPVSLTRAGDGWRRLAVELSPGLHMLEVRGTVDTPDGSLQLPVARGVSGRLQASGDGLAFAVSDAVATRPGRWDLRPGDAIDVRWVPARPAPPRPRVVTFDGAIALRGGEGGVEGAARLRYRVLDGTVSSLVLQIPGGVDQLEVRGRQVARHRVEGERVLVELKEPVSGRLQLDLAWRGSGPRADLGAAPVVQPRDARGTATITLVRGDDSMLVPVPGRGMTPVATDDVPRWGRGLVAGQPLVAYRTDAAERAELQWQRLDWQPVDAPPTLVDEARYTVVHAEHGRVHVRAVYQVRNDRNPFLRLRLPEGWEAVGVRVAGRATELVRAADGRWLVPLEKSVETLDGLVAFPVELMLVGDEPEWERRGLRVLQTPSVDAPIAYAGWEVRLPRAVHQRDIEGRPTLVDAWTPKAGGLLIGRATGIGLDEVDEVDSDQDVLGENSRSRRGGLGRRGQAAASRDLKHKETGGRGREKAGESETNRAVSQEYWNRAYSAYKLNDFDEVESLLQQSLAFDAGNTSARSLQENVDVLRGEADLDAGQQAAANRVRELARARTGDVELAQTGKVEEAERKLRAGDRSGARAAYQELIELTEQLAAVEQSEAIDQKSRLSAYRQQVAMLGGEDGPDDARVDPAGVRRVASPRSGSLSTPGAKGKPHVGTLLARKKSTEKRRKAEPRRTVSHPEDALSDLSSLTMEGELLKPQGALLLDRRIGASPAPVAEPSPPVDPPAPSPAPSPAPVLQVPEAHTLDRLVEGRGSRAAIEGARGLAGPVPVEAGSVTIYIPETVEEQQAFDALVGGEMFGLRGHGLGGGGVAVVDPGSRDPFGPPAAAAFPSDGEAASVEAVSRGPAVAPAHPIHHGPLMPAMPTADTGVSPAYPRAPSAAEPWPQRPPPPPAVSFGLDVPDGITASTLSLSLPQTGTGLLLEQRLLPPDEPLRFTLKYRHRR